MPAGDRLTVDIDGTPQPVCCIGCQSVALLIRGANLTAFYRQRTDFSPSPAEEPGATASWFADADWVADFATTTAAGGLAIPLLVSGMSCAACTWLLERTLQTLPEVAQVDINLTLSRVVLTLRPGSAAEDAVRWIEQLGYRVRPWRTDDRLDQLRADTKRDIRRLGVAAIGMMQASMFAIALHAGDLQGIDLPMQQLLRWFSAPIALFVLFYSGRSFLSNAWHSLRRGQLIMDSSVSLALLLGTAASLWATVRGNGETYYDSVTMFIFFLLLARFIERRLRNADLLRLVSLEDQLPEFVTVLRDQRWQRIPRSDIDVGERLRISAGEAIAFDGDIVSGQSQVEEAVFTGEALPRWVGPGDRVFAGTVNRDASLEATVASSYRDSRLAALQEHVNQARQAKPRYLQLIDRWAGGFVAFVFLAAAAAASYWWNIAPEKSLWTALAVLVVACPCALSLATPAALASAGAWLQQHRVWVHGEYGLLAAPDIDTVLIDKTGTLTETELAIGTVVTGDRIDVETAIGIAAALQQFSQHPAARSFHGLTAAADVDHVETVPGRGMSGTWRGGTVRLGSQEFCAELGPVPPPPDNGHYWVALADHRGWLAWLGLGEQLRHDAAQLIDALRARGLTIQLVSGDSAPRVAAIAQRLGIAYTAGAMPADKLALLADLQARGQRVLAIGDGLNDAPFLGAADVSIAVANATALTRVEADFAVDDARLAALLSILDIAKRTRRIIHQNLFWAAGYNLLGIPFAAVGWVPPWVAAIGMSLSSLLVVLNALRLRRFRSSGP